MAFKTWAIIQRRYQEMFNTKISSLAMILGPIIMILVAGIALNDDSLKNVEANIYVGERNDFADKIADKLRLESFNIKVSPTLGDCRWPVLEGVSQVCIEIGKRDINSPLLGNHDSYGYKIKLHVDFSRQRTVWAVISKVDDIIEEESSKVRGELADKIKSRLGEVIADIDDALDEVTSAKRELYLFEEEVETAKDKVSTAKDYVTKAEGTLTEVGTLISSLENYGVDTIAPTEYNNLKSKHTEAEITINQIKEEIGYADNALDRAEEKINPTTDALTKTENYLREMQNDLISLRESDFNELLHPIPLSYSPVAGENVEASTSSDLGLIDYLFPSFLIFFIMFASIILSNSSTIKERSSPAFIRNMTSKAAGFSFVFGNFFTTFSIVALQTATILVVGSRFLGFSLLNNLGAMTGILTLAIAWFILIGLTIGYLVKSSESANIAAVSLALILLIFMPVITPTETLPEPFSTGVKILPSNIYESQLKSIILFDVPFGFRPQETLSITISFIILISILTLLYQRAKRKEI